MTAFPTVPLDGCQVKPETLEGTLELPKQDPLLRSTVTSLAKMMLPPSGISMRSLPSRSQAVMGIAVFPVEHASVPTAVSLRTLSSGAP